MHVNGSNNLAVQYSTGLTVDNDGKLAVDETVIATKSYVDATAQGLSVLGSVRAASTANITIAGTGSIDGVTLSNNDRVLLKNQDTATENGIYVYSLVSGLQLSTNAEDTDIKEGSFVFIEEGSQAAQGWIVTAFSAGASTWTQFSSAGEYTAGYGIDITTGSISVKLDSDSLAKSADGLKVNLSSTGAIQNDGGLYVNVGDGITINGSNQVAIDTSTVVRKSTTTIGNGVDTSYSISHNFDSYVEVSVYDANTGAQVETDVTTVSMNTVSIGFATAPAADSYVVVVQG